MANRFEFAVVALDKYTKTLRDVNRKVTRAFRPVQQAGRALGALGREAHLDKLGAGLDKIGQSAAALAEHLGIASPAMAAIANLGLRGGMVAAAGAVGYLGVRVGKLGTDVERTSNRLGMSTSNLQRFRGAAQLAGLTADDMDDSLTSLGQTMQNARFNRDPKAAIMFREFTGGIATGPGGANDVGEQMKRVLEAASKIKDPFARQKFLTELGLGSTLMPLAAGGRRGFNALMDQADAKGYVLRGDALRNAVKFNAELWQLNVAFQGLASTIGTKLLPGITSTTRFLTDLVEHPWKTLTFQRLGKHDEPLIDSSGNVMQPGLHANGRGRGQTLGMSLNNPGNLRRWGTRPIEHGFASFDTPEQGLQAMANLLTRYQDVYKLRTVDDILKTYAPPQDGNDDDAYAADVNKRAGFKPGETLDVHSPTQLAALMSAMVQHEQGKQPFTPAQYQNAAEHVVRIEISGQLPPGVNVKATSANGDAIPTRIDRSMVSSLSVE